MHQISCSLNPHLDCIDVQPFAELHELRLVAGQGVTSRQTECRQGLSLDLQLICTGKHLCNPAAEGTFCHMCTSTAFKSLQRHCNLCNCPSIVLLFTEDEACGKESPASLMETKLPPVSSYFLNSICDTRPVCVHTSMYSKNHGGKLPVLRVL